MGPVMSDWVPCSGCSGTPPLLPWFVCTGSWTRNPLLLGCLLLNSLRYQPPLSPRKLRCIKQRFSRNTVHHWMKTFNDFQIARSVMDVSSFLIGQFSASVVDVPRCARLGCFCPRMNNRSGPVEHPLTPGGDGLSAGLNAHCSELCWGFCCRVPKLVQMNPKHQSDTNCQQPWLVSLLVRDPTIEMFWDC